MVAAIYNCPEEWEYLLPLGTCRVQRVGELAGHIWPLLALTRNGELSEWEGEPLLCRVLLAPGDCPELLSKVKAERVISYGLSPRDSLTLSSLAEPVLCVQRTLPRPDGSIVEPQEVPLPRLPAPAEAMLPVLGLRMLQMPLTEGRFP